MPTTSPFRGVIGAVAGLICLMPPLFAADKGSPAEAGTPSAAERHEKLLKQRLSGGMSYTFAQFGNMFLVSSGQQLDTAVGLMTASKEIAETPLVSPFPKFYKPTLSQFLDAIALQTFSEWKHDSSGKFIKGKDGGAADGPVIFEFTPKKRAKPYEIVLREGWKSEDKGNWTMFIPSSFPVGMDIYEMGTYTSGKPADEGKLLKRVPEEVSLEWARRVKKQVDKMEIQSAKVGPYGALFFETTVTAQNGATLHWRQWVFMVENTCYFIVSTIVPDLENTIFPDVEAMLKTFKVKKP